ncbi:MAG: crossover junction endodeoxyribonuclease RuvC [Chloroflexi bacterium]|nr:crossover junction endodeoxyribonuclease RuvC [Chloroflexota bacterium]
MRVLGVDPGTLHMGYGVLEGQDPPRLIASGTLKAATSAEVGVRLYTLYLALEEVVRCWEPQHVAVEEPSIVAQARRSALAVGQAVGLALLVAASHSLPVATYSPSQVKYAITDYGRSTKEQVQQMVRLQLGLRDDLSPDAADAVAVALCHLQALRVKALIRGA